MLASQIRAYQKLRRLKGLMVQDEDAAIEENTLEAKTTAANAADFQTPALKSARNIAGKIAPIARQ